MESFNEHRFKEKVNSALEVVRRILENNRHPQIPEDIPHEYGDKYLLAEFLTNTSLGAQVNALERLGVSGETLKELRGWAKSRSVTLRMKTEEVCTFNRKAVRKVESASTHVTTWTGGMTRKDKVVTKITEWFWDFEVKYSLIAYKGNSPDKGITIRSGQGACELVTTTDKNPKKESVSRPHLEVNITWLLSKISDHGHGKFHIDRSVKSCHTPRRNKDIETGLKFGRKFYTWAESVRAYFLNILFPVEPKHSFDLSAMNIAGVFVPIVALFEEKGKRSLKSHSHGKLKKERRKSKNPSKELSVIPSGLSSDFLGEQKRSLDEKLKTLVKVFPKEGNNVITLEAAEVVVLIIHLKDICQRHHEGVDYIEAMLHNQLVAAIGKEVSSVDFTNYMIFHNRKLFRAQYQPKPFSFAIRRPDHYPEGVLSIEATLDGGGIPDPIYTTVCKGASSHPMRFSLNASTEVEFGGERYLHGWISHQFSGYSGSKLNLVARARQFSSFILLVGRIASADLFQPKYGIIIQNKDDLKIPLMLETIPTPKEFRDAIASLSPEQQRFAKAFRSMKLESTLFGVCVIQIKPQLEKLLKIPNDSLTKEIELTQDLMSLFIEYQIPSDLITYDGPAGANVQSKIRVVKEYVNTMKAMIDKAKSKQLSEAEQKQDFRITEIYNSSSISESFSEETWESEDECDDMDYNEPVITKKRYKAPSSLFKKMKKGMSSPREKRSSGTIEFCKCEKGGSINDSKLDAISEKVSTGKSSKQVTRKADLARQDVEVEKESEAPVEDAIDGDKAEKPSKEFADVTEEKCVTDVDIVDYTKVPAEMDRKFEELDEDSALRPTIINPGDNWRKTFLKSLLSKPEESNISLDDQKTEKNKAFDLLDALSRSGVLSIDEASLHVVIAATHCFDKSLMDTVIQDNVNPVEKVERSSLIVGSTIHNVEPETLLLPSQVERVSTYSPILFTQAAIEEGKETATKKNE